METIGTLTRSVPFVPLTEYLSRIEGSSVLGKAFGSIRRTIALPLSQSAAPMYYDK
jgi:hypothetical protein